MEVKKFCVKELKIDEENPALGIHAISFVERPAIQTEFEYFAKDEPLPFFKYTADPEPEVIATSHPFCRKHAGHIFHVSEINSFEKQRDDSFIKDSTGAPIKWFANFKNTMENYNIDQQLYNCRHYFLRVDSIDQVPKNKRSLMKSTLESEDLFFKFEISNQYKKRVRGLVLKSHQLIYRGNADGQGNPGYVYMTGETVKKLQEKFGYNRTITFQHRETITGQAILMDSWLEEKEKDVGWYMEYQIVGDALWAQVEAGKVKGFSVEMLMKVG